MMDFEAHERYARQHHLLKRFNGEEYWWFIKDKSRNMAEYHASVAQQNGFRYRIERIREFSRVTLTTKVRYNVWVRRK